MVQNSHSQIKRVFRRLPKAAKESDSVTVCGVEHSRVGSRVGKGSETKLFVVCFSTTLGICRRVAMTSEGVVQGHMGE